MEWLESEYTVKANEAGEEVLFHLSCLAWGEPLGCYFDFDESHFEDMINHPEAYDLGWSLRGKITDISDDWAQAISEGAKLNAAELTEVKNIVDNSQDESDGTNCFGFTVNFNENITLFAAFTGLSSGQGGVGYSFYRIFRDNKFAEEYFSNKGDGWWNI